LLCVWGAPFPPPNNTLASFWVAAERPASYIFDIYLRAQLNYEVDCTY
jgi:hypothetical protein